MKITTITASLLLVLGAVSASSAATVEGFAKGRVDRDYGDLPAGVPLMSSFYFRYHKSGGAVDHHINAISVKPDPENGTVALMYQDKNRDDTYFYKASLDSIPSSSVIRGSIADVGCTGKCERTLSPPGSGYLFVLTGFQVNFTGGRDHHVDEIAVFEDEGVLTVMLNDKNDDDVFAYSVDYAWVSPTVFLNSGASRGTNNGGVAVSLPTGRHVVRGFHFNYLSGDHHLREIGALTSGSRLDVYYGDKNGDDLFSWEVRWATLKPRGPGTGPVAPIGPVAPSKQGMQFTAPLQGAFTLAR